MTEFVPIFPTTIAKENVRITEQEKEIAMLTLLNHFDSDGLTGEVEGFVDLHCETSLRFIYEAVSKCIKDKLQFFNINADSFDINIIKSWMNIVRERHTPLHAHYDAHWSFSYYINIPDNLQSKPIQFEQVKHPNDPYSGLITYNSESWNDFNCMTYQFVPQEGDIYIFPSNLLHSTVGYGNGEEDIAIRTVNDLKANRICIAGDVLFTHNQKANVCLGLQPKDKWLSL